MNQFIAVITDAKLNELERNVRQAEAGVVAPALAAFLSVRPYAASTERNPRN